MRERRKEKRERERKIQSIYVALNIIYNYFYYNRKVTSESATGSSTSERVRTTLTISVETIEYDTFACQVRFKGRNVQENQFVKMGAYHTIDLQLNQKFTLSKEKWDSVALDRLGMSSYWGMGEFILVFVSIF